MGGAWMALLLEFAAPAGATSMRACPKEADQARIELENARKAKDPRREARAHQKYVCKCVHPGLDCDEPEGIRKLALGHWLAGAGHYQNGEDAKAYKEWRACVLLDPDNVDCRKGLERIDRARAEPPAKGAWPPRKKVGEKAVSRKADAGKADGKTEALKRWHAGMAYFQKGDYEKAQSEWRLCEKLDPTNQDCWMGLRRLDNTYGGP